MTDKPKKLVPALVGGLVLAALSSIPIVSLANVACCSWAIVGGGVAAYMLVKRSPVLRVTSGEGALAGLLAGFVGSLLLLLINMALIMPRWPEIVASLQQEAERQIEREESSSAVLTGTPENELVPPPPPPRVPPVTRTTWDSKSWDRSFTRRSNWLSDAII